MSEKRIAELCQEKGWVDAATCMMVAKEVGVDRVVEILAAQPEARRMFPGYAEYLKSEHWEKVRQWALSWAGYRCMVCNAAEPLQVHHRTYENLGHELPTDVIALCGKHHKMAHEIT